MYLSRFTDPPGLKTKPREIDPTKTDQYYPAAVTWEFAVVVPKTATPGAKTLTLAERAKLQVCNKDNCFYLTRDELPTAAFEVLDADAENPVTADLDEAEKRLGSRGVAPKGPTVPSVTPPGPREVQPPAPAPPQAGLIPVPTEVRKPALTTDDYKARLDDTRAKLVHDTSGGGTGPGGGDQGLWAFLATAAAWGLISLVTPCVFPMIPITMSFFLNSGGKPFQQAVGFCLGIIVLFTGLGFATTAILGPFGIVQLGSNVWVNGFIGLVFAAFGLSLLGAFEITMPSGLLTKLNSASQGGGFAGTLLMGLTFALTSFACVGPFMGTLLAASVQGDKLQPAVGMATFAAGLASPFFFLALFPNYLKKMPRSGGWLARVKIVIGFIVLALALKYLSNVDAVMQWSLLTRERYLALWVILFALPGLYVLGLMRMEGIKPEEPVGVTRALVGAIFLAFSVSLVPGMFGMQLGELEAYVPASHGSPFGGGGSESKLAWMKDDYQGALAKARAENKVVLVNFTGYACTNCKWMKANMFTKPEIASALSRFVLVDLYTDGSDPASLANQQLQETRFQTVAIPHYALVRPDESIVASFTGQTRNVQEYLDFLNKGLAPQGAPAPKTTE